MKSEWKSSARALAVLTLLTGIAYPLAVTLFAHLGFRDLAQGSLLTKDGRIVGSSLIAQKFTDAKYFQPRPSSSDYATFPAGASNLSPASQTLAEGVKKRRGELEKETPGEVPADLLTTSASGLDPHISPAAARFQLAQVARARGVTPEELSPMIAQSVEDRTLGIFGVPRVNVLRLNLLIDTRFRKGAE